MSNDSLEHQIIELTQAGLPLVNRPYLALANSLDISEEELFTILQSMKDRGLIRRIGLVPNHYAIGYVFNLMTVWDINDPDIDHVGQLIGGLDFVSHCYQRPRHLPDWPYNFFAMVHGRDQQEVDEKMTIIEKMVAAYCQQFCALKSTRILKKTGIRI